MPRLLNPVIAPRYREAVEVMAGIFNLSFYSKSVHFLRPQSPCASGSGLKYLNVPMHYPMPPSAQEETRESTLGWFIRALNGLQPKEQRELLMRIPGTSA